MKKNSRIIENENCIKIEGIELPNHVFYLLEEAKNIPYLSWENATYMYANRQEEETDDYLLYHALQEDKKLCASFYTSKPQEIINVFKDDQRFNIVYRELKNTVHEGYSIVIVVRKGTLSEYFDMEKIEDIYVNKGIDSIGSLPLLETKEMVDLVSGKVEDFDIFLDISNPYEDKTIRLYRASAIIIIGLLLGYPIETTLNLLEGIGIK